MVTFSLFGELIYRRMKISAIVAMGNNRVIGVDNKMPWHLPSDLRYFKQITMGHPMIMGRKCFDSIGKPLPGRTTIVLSRNESLSIGGCVMKSSLQEALGFAKNLNTDEIFIVGGAEIYNLSKPMWTKIYVTHVDVSIKGDTFFPEIDLSDWRVILNDPRKKDKKNAFDFTFRQYTKP